MRVSSLIFAVALVGLCACEDSSFSGAVGKKRAANTDSITDSDQDPRFEDPDDPRNSGDGRRRGGTDNGGLDREPIPDPGGGGGSNPNPNPSIGSDTDNVPSLLETLGDLITGGVGDRGSLVNDNEILFGRNNKVFHIGDGRLLHSSCLASLISHPLTGVQYYFEFQVLNNNTSVSIEIREVCGVDGVNNTVALYDLRSRANVAEDGTIAELASFHNLRSVTLNAGNYAVVVESGLSEPDNGNPDLDDFVIGKVRIRASGAIRPGRVGARN